MNFVFSKKFVQFHLTALLILAFIMFYSPMLSIGDIWAWDEYHTLERSTAFARYDDWWTVYSQNKPNFNKPPLQYWVTALLLETSWNQVAALRLPSFYFAIATLIVIAFLAASISQSSVSTPLAVLLTGSSAQFWYFGTSAMLDAGATFFVTLAAAAAIMALRHSTWWYVVAIAIVLGALQKAPVALIVTPFVLIITVATQRWHGVSWSSLWQTRSFRISTIVALLGSFAWPILQFVQHGLIAPRLFFKREMLNRFAPSSSIERSLSDLYGLLVVDEPFIRLPAILALTTLPFVLRRYYLIPFPILYVVFAMSMFLAGGYVNARYSLIFLPLLCAALAAVLPVLLRKEWLAAIVGIAVSAASGGPFKHEVENDLRPDRERIAQIRVLKQVGMSLRNEDQLIVCNWDENSFPPGAISLFASNGQPFRRLTTDPNGRKLNVRGTNLVILCTPSQLDSFQRGFLAGSQITQLDGYVLVRVGSKRKSQMK